ncbi:MerR family DNA-binding protein [Streptomyces sp. NRRL S-1448]|uniref:helix-turn-helix domain-containing protein n=1 Tax=Streptomyces sp. NRRL S-1448 TaxID=1463883 RepID=UPI001F2E807A
MSCESRGRGGTRAGAGAGAPGTASTTPTLARLELARALRDLGLGLPQIREVLDREHTLAEMAAVHVDTLEVQIRALRCVRSRRCCAPSPAVPPLPKDSPFCPAPPVYPPPNAALPSMTS